MYPHNELFFLSSSCHSRLYCCQCAVILVTRYEVVSVIDFNPDIDVTLTSIVGCARVWIRLWTGSKWFRIQYIGGIL